MSASVTRPIVAALLLAFAVTPVAPSAAQAAPQFSQWGSVQELEAGWAS